MLLCARRWQTLITEAMSSSSAAAPQQVKNQPKLSSCCCLLPQVPKLGYVATAPGSMLKFTVDTSSTTQTGAADPHTVVTLSHMKSYEGMGQAGASVGCSTPFWTSTH